MAKKPNTLHRKKKLEQHTRQKTKGEVMCSTSNTCLLNNMIVNTTDGTVVVYDRYSVMVNQVMIATWMT